MAFTLSGSTITQSGTDTSYAGLNGLAGVTRLATGDGFLYYMPTLRLVVSGTITIADPSKNTFIASRLSVPSTGIFSSGSFASDGVTPLYSGTHFVCVDGTQASAGFDGTASLEVNTSGSFTAIGGQYLLAGGVFYANAAIIREYSAKYVSTKTYGGASVRIRSYSTNIIKRNCEHYDAAFDLFRMPDEFSVKCFGAEYVAQYVGSLGGGADAKFVASALSNTDGSADFDNWGVGWVELYDCAKGANLNVTNGAGRSNHCVPLYQNINFTVTDLAGTAQQNVRLRCIDAPVSNSPTTTITTTGSLKTWDFRNAQTYTGTTNASGKATLTPVLQVWHGASNLKNLRFAASTATIRCVGYAVRQQDVTVVLGSDTAIAKGVAMVSATGITLTETQAAALTGISLVASGTTSGTMTVTASRTTSELWQFWRNFKGLIANADSADSWEYAGVVLNAGAWNVTNSGTITGGITSSGTITNSGTLSGVITGNVTNTGTMASGTSITGNVTQATPTNLTGVTITGNLTYNTNTDATIYFNNTTVTGTVSNTGTGTITILLVGTAAVGTTGAGIGVATETTINALDPQNFGTTWVLGWIKTSDWTAANKSNPPNSWAWWAEKSGTGNSTTINLAPATEYQLFLRIPGYFSPIGPVATVNTATQSIVGINLDADIDEDAQVLWPQTAAYSTDAAKFTYDTPSGYIRYLNAGAETDYVNFRAAYRALELITKAPAAAFGFIQPVFLNGTNNGFLVPPSAPVWLTMHPDSTAAAIIEADVRYSDTQLPAFDRFLATSPYLYLIHSTPRAQISTADKQQIASGSATAVRTELAAELTQVTKVAKLHGVGAALVVTPTTRVAGSVSQTITTVDTTTTVQEV